MRLRLQPAPGSKIHRGSPHEVEDKDATADEADFPEVVEVDDARSHIRKRMSSRPPADRQSQPKIDVREECELIAVESTRSRLYVFVAPRMGKKKPKSEP